MKYFLMGAVIILLAGCGGSRDRGYGVPEVKIASGPISKACMAGGRKARSTRLCGCIQSVANISLSSADQRRATGFFEDPHKAQEVRQSDRVADEAFWKRYVAFANLAEANCKGV